MKLDLLDEFYNDGKKDGEKDGMKKGIEKVAINLLKNGYSKEEVEKVTNLLQTIK